MSEPSNLSYLDKMRLLESPEKFKKDFRDIVEGDRASAILHINHENLEFPSLFLLVSEIDKMGLYGDLNYRNSTSLQICALKMSKYRFEDFFSELSDGKGEDVHRAVLWMFETGSRWEAPASIRSGYDAVVDAAAAILVVMFQDHAILQALSELIFIRNRKGLLIHDLVWCFFQVQEPQHLRLIADNLLSSEKADVELACLLLHVKDFEKMDSDECKRLHSDILAWLDANQPYLYMTGEFFQLTSEPEPVKVNLEARYLCKKVSPRDGSHADTLTFADMRSLKELKNIPEEDRRILSAYSSYLNKRDKSSWDRWIRNRPADNLEVAKAGVEALSDNYK